MRVFNGLARPAHGSYVATSLSPSALMEVGVRVRLIALVTLVVGLSVGPAMAAPLLSLSPSNTTVHVGQTFSLDVEISGLEGPPTCSTGLPDCTDLWAYQFDIFYNPQYLKVVQQGTADITEGPFLASGGGTTNFVAGVDGIYLNTLDPNDPNNGNRGVLNTLNFLTFNDPGVFGGGVLATVMFQALATGAHTR